MSDSQQALWRWRMVHERLLPNMITAQGPMKAEQFKSGESQSDNPLSTEMRIAQLEAVIRELRSDLARLARLCPPNAERSSSDVLYEIYRRNVVTSACGCPRGQMKD